MTIGETYSESITRTYTTADVGKVLDCFAADLDGIGQSTGLAARDETKAIAADVKLMAQAGYLSLVSVYLDDPNGRTLRAANYEVSTDAWLLTASRPGNYLWPRLPAGQLFIHVTYSAVWSNLPELQKERFRQRLGVQWGSKALDTSFPTLSRVFDRNYVSNGFGLQKTLFT
ncbi:MAG: hypothetical protein HYY46_26220 [Deltaproteobacteria bacterium]|nr:hypothetical protein [Deltaproteobacteria bacterium]